MYLPTHFAQTDTAALHTLMRQYPLAAVIVNAASGITADHIPLLLSTAPVGQVFLRGHVARANPLWKLANADAGTPCLVVFQGAQHYISPNGYASKALDHRAVPTWNYEVVHVQGVLRAFDGDSARLQALLADLTAQHESSQPAPWSMHDAPADYLQKMQSAVVNIEVEVNLIQGKFKLSQNQSAGNQASLMTALNAAQTPASAAMAQRIASHRPASTAALSIQR